MTRTLRFGRRTLASRLLAAYALGLVAVLAVLAVPLSRRLETDWLNDLTSSLTNDARAARRALTVEGEALQSATASLGRELGERITIIQSDGTVLADSEHDPAAMVNHSTRPEVREALAGRVGVATRTSETVGRPFRYVALPPDDERIVRVAISLDQISDRLNRARLLIGAAAALALAVGLVAAWVIARTLTRPLARVTDAATRIGAGDFSVRAPERGSAEVVALASAINRMASDLAARIEEAQSDRRVRDVVLDAMTDGVVLIDHPDGVQYANPAAARLLGRASEPATSGGYDRPFIPPSLRRLAEDARRDAAPRSQEIEIGRPPRTVLASALPVADGVVLLVLRDVTEMLRIEAIRRDFVTAASHELKTPVASIQAAAETLGHAVHEDPEAARRFARNLLRDAERLSRIVRDLLDLSRLEGERGSVEPVRLDSLAREEVDRITDASRDAGLTLQAELGPATVQGSRRDLGLLISNLLDNALRYTRPGGTVRIEVSGRNGEARVVVSDTGIGIPARELPRIFERFYRVDRARSRDTGGTGLGLSIVKHVAEQHGGRVRAQSELGRGSTFVVTIPTGE